MTDSPSAVLPGPQIKKAFFALVANGVRAAPLWDSKKQSFVGEEGLGRWRWGGRERRDPVRRFWGQALMPRRLEQTLRLSQFRGQSGGMFDSHLVVASWETPSVEEL